MSLSLVLFEMNTVVILSLPFQVAHGPFIVVILAHNIPQSGGEVWIFLLLEEKMIKIKE